MADIKGTETATSGEKDHIGELKDSTCNSEASIDIEGTETATSGEKDHIGELKDSTCNSEASTDIKGTETATSGEKDHIGELKDSSTCNSEASTEPVEMVEKTTTDSGSCIGLEKAQETQNNNDHTLPNKTDNVQGDKTKESKSSKVQDVNDKQLSEHDYEIIDGKYYYTDTVSGQKYVYDESAGQWVLSDDHQQVTTDEEGRTYYYAQDMYLCRDAQENVFFLDKNNEWVPWGTDTKKQEENAKWYFHQGDNMFYRDRISNVVYRLNKESNEWEVYEGKLKAKRPRIDTEEEFDTDEEEEDSDDDCKGLAPPGARNDPSIDYDGYTYTKRDPGDNMVYEWDTTRRAWFPKLDEDFMATYQLSYGFNPDGTKNENPLKFDDEIEADEEAKLLEEEEQKKLKASQQKSKPTWFEMDEGQNTKVYVSNLPDSTTEEEFLDLMQKCGMILKETDGKSFKIKMYKDSEGNFKGDALCTYIKRESVELALQILDDYQVENQKIHVEQAKFQLKGKYDPKLKPRKKRKKELEKLQKKQEKLFDWRPEPMRGMRQKHERTVIIRKVFDPEEFENSVEKILTHKEAMRNQCLNFGQVNKLDIHDLHPDGVVQVTFSEVEAADMCVATLDNRLYNGHILKVATWDGKEKFRIEETAEQREERLKKWNKFLESDKEKEK